MQIYCLASTIPTLCDTVPEGAIFLLGCFDGVHLGHRTLLNKAVAAAVKESPARPVVVWSLESAHKASAESGLLTTQEEKLSLLAEYGADYVIFERFEDIRSLEGQVFFNRHIVAPYHPCAVICGENFRFGYMARSTADDLAAFAAEAGISCTVVDLLKEQNGTSVSSTEIRRLLLAGDAAGAHRLLGRPYTVTAPILHGKALGRTLGCPTVNQKLPAGKVIPAFGVYACTVSFIKDQKTHTFAGVCNIGSRPTVNEDRKDVNLETYILDFADDLYGVTVTTRLYHRIRGEVAFADVQALSQQIHRDAASAQALLKTQLPMQK